VGTASAPAAGLKTGEEKGTRDYIVTHYKTNSRTDTEYWRANAANRNISEPLKQLLNLWMSGNSIAPMVRKQTLGRG
jgi:hypothetical protein